MAPDLVSAFSLQPSAFVSSSPMNQSSTFFRAQGVLRRNVRLDFTLGLNWKHRMGMRRPISLQPCRWTSWLRMFSSVMPCRGSRGWEAGDGIVEFEVGDGRWMFLQILGNCGEQFKDGFRVWQRPHRQSPVFKLPRSAAVSPTSRSTLIILRYQAGESGRLNRSCCGWSRTKRDTAALQSCCGGGRARVPAISAETD